MSGSVGVGEVANSERRKGKDGSEAGEKLDDMLEDRELFLFLLNLNDADEVVENERTSRSVRESVASSKVHQLFRLREDGDEALDLEVDERGMVEENGEEVEGDQMERDREGFELRETVEDGWELRAVFEVKEGEVDVDELEGSEGEDRNKGVTWLPSHSCGDV